MIWRKFTKTAVLKLLLLTGFSVALFGIARAQDEGVVAGSSATALYTAHNIWFEKPEVIYVINYKRGQMIPAGTEVTSVRIGNRNIRFQAVGWEGYEFNFILGKHQGNLTIGAVHERTFVHEPLLTLTEEMTEHEIRCIESGSVEPGMSKKAVLISQGYPPRHRPPNLDLRQWIYWGNRFKNFIVKFDGEGRVIQ